MDLPDDLKLPLGSGAQWWYWLGGRPATDFVNTHRERWWRNVETLVTTSDLCQWLQTARLLSSPAETTDARLRSARRLRGAIDAGIQASIAHSALPTPGRGMRSTAGCGTPLRHPAWPTRNVCPC